MIYFGFGKFRTARPGRMAQLLGSRFCIESLHNDVSDLQAVVVDVFSRTGPVTQPSWKYPDKAASNIHMDELLEIYVYTDDEEERQVAHIVLLELVIDRCGSSGVFFVCVSFA